MYVSLHVIISCFDVITAACSDPSMDAISDIVATLLTSSWLFSDVITAACSEVLCLCIVALNSSAVTLEVVVV